MYLFASLGIARICNARTSIIYNLIHCLSLVDLTNNVISVQSKLFFLAIKVTAAWGEGKVLNALASSEVHTLRQQY